MLTLKILAKCFRRIFFDSPRVLRNSTPDISAYQALCHHRAMKTS